MSNGYRVSRKDLDTGTKIEQREHPWASPARARRIARDHLHLHPKAYSIEPVVDKILRNRERKIKPIKRRLPSRPFNPLTDDPFGHY